VQLAAETSHFPLSAAFGTVTWGERTDAKTRVRGIDLAAGAGAWAIGLQAWEGTREIPAATTKPWWDVCSFGFTGREHDSSGLVYARARYLQSEAGRWDRPDPLGMADGPNRYVYVSSAPALRTDPTGLFEADVHNAVTAEAFAGVLTGIDFALVVEVATHDADALNNQFDDYRHGMRAQGTSLDQGIQRWVEFVDGEMAYGVAWGNSRCAEPHQAGLRELGYGVHAVEDYFSPPHHMQVMDWSREGFARHKAGEKQVAARVGTSSRSLPSCARVRVPLPVVARPADERRSRYARGHGVGVLRTVPFHRREHSTLMSRPSEGGR
jgi:RHS repeat-associated protein